MDIRKLDLNLLPMLDALLRRQSVTLAAKELNLSQSTLSGHLSRLRRHFGDPLLVRTSQGLRPTPKGHSLVPALREMQSMLGSLSAATDRFDPATSTRHFRLGCSETACWVLGATFDAECRGTAPGVRCDWIAIESIGMSQALEDGLVDLAVGEYESVSNYLLQKRLYSMKTVCAVSATHQILKSPQDLSEFAHYSLIRTQTRSTAHKCLEKYLSSIGLPSFSEIIVPSVLGIPNFVSLSNHFALLPEPLARASSYDGQITSFDLPFESDPLVVRMLWHPRFSEDAGMIWIRDALSKCTSHLSRRV